MNKTVEVVKPACVKGETTGFLITVFVVLLVWGLGVYGRTRTESHIEVEPWQINVFSDLNPKEQGIYTDLVAAASEIYMIYIDESNSWCTLEDLQEYGLAPFNHDVVWQQRACIDWKYIHRKNEVVDEAYYIGIPEVSGGIGAFILSIHKDIGVSVEENAEEIWYIPKNNLKLPESFSDASLISAGWKQLVAYKGEDELARIKGEF